MPRRKHQMTENHYGSYDREQLQYELIMRQEPKHARMCGSATDRRPIDPPPIIQLKVLPPMDNTGRGTSPAPSVDEIDHANNVALSKQFLQNPYYFMFAALCKPDTDEELTFLKDGRTKFTIGSAVSSLYNLKENTKSEEDIGLFVFPDLSVRAEGSYKLRFSLYEVTGREVRLCKSIFSKPFYVYTAKKFPGMEESTPLSCSLAEQGIKIRIRKDIRARKRQAASSPTRGGRSRSRTVSSRSPSASPHVSQSKPNKRRRKENQSNADAANAVANAGLPAWPTGNGGSVIDPVLEQRTTPSGQHERPVTPPYDNTRAPPPSDATPGAPSPQRPAAPAGYYAEHPPPPGTYHYPPYAAHGYPPPPPGWDGYYYQHPPPPMQHPQGPPSGRSPPRHAGYAPTAHPEHGPPSGPPAQHAGAPPPHVGPPPPHPSQPMPPPHAAAPPAHAGPPASHSGGPSPPHSHVGQAPSQHTGHAPAPQQGSSAAAPHPGPAAHSGPPSGHYGPPPHHGPPPAHPHYQNHPRYDGYNYPGPPPPQSYPSEYYEHPNYAPSSSAQGGPPPSGSAPYDYPSGYARPGSPSQHPPRYPPPYGPYYAPHPGYPYTGGYGRPPPAGYSAPPQGTAHPGEWSAPPPPPPPASGNAGYQQSWPPQESPGSYGGREGQASGDRIQLAPLRKPESDYSSRGYRGDERDRDGERSERDNRRKVMSIPGITEEQRRR